MQPEKHKWDYKKWQGHKKLGDHDFWMSCLFSTSRCQLMWLLTVSGAHCAQKPHVCAVVRPHSFSFLHNGSCGGVSVYTVTSSTSQVAQNCVFHRQDPCKWYTLNQKLSAFDDHWINKSACFVLGTARCGLGACLSVRLCQLWLSTVTKGLQRSWPTMTKMPVQTQLNAGKW